MRSLAFCICGLLLVGCQSAPQLPTYPMMDARATQAAMADRARAIADVSAQGIITLTRTNGETIRLDAAVVMAPPDRARIRAWKFNQVVFDMTVTPQGVWLLRGDDPARKDQMLATDSGAARIASTWSLLSGGFFSQSDLSSRVDGGKIVFSQLHGFGGTECRVDRATLTARAYWLSSIDGSPEFVMKLDDYAVYGQYVWPRKITATGNLGTMVIELREVEINGGLAAGAFIPPARAEKLP